MTEDEAARCAAARSSALAAATRTGGVIEHGGGRMNRERKSLVIYASELANSLGCVPETLPELTRRDGLPAAVKIGGRWAWSRGAVEAWLARKGLARKGPANE